MCTAAPISTAPSAKELDSLSCAVTYVVITIVKM